MAGNCKAIVSRTMLFCASIMLLILVTGLSCSDSNSHAGDCLSNMECPGASACVLGACISEPSKCRKLGAFEKIASRKLAGVDSVVEAHTVFDNVGAVHYCYVGSKNGQLKSIYGVQRSAGSFEEIAIQSATVQSAGCNALAVSATGIPYVLDAQNAVLMYRANNTWRALTLPEIETNEERAELAGNDTVVHLTPDANGGMHIAISAGYTHIDQEMYLAHIANDVFTVLANGIRNPDSAKGHAPEFVHYILNTPEPSTDTATSIVNEWTPAYVSGDLRHTSISFNDPIIGPMASLEGGYQRVVQDVDGSAYVLYVDNNYILRIARLVRGNFFDQGIVGQIDFDSPKAQVPWTFAVNPPGTAHVLYEDNTQGYSTLSYKEVRRQLETEVAIISTGLGRDLGESQHYAVNADMCGRATVAVIEQIVAKDTETLQYISNFVLTIKEQR